MNPRTGSHFIFNPVHESLLRKQWESESLNPWLRVAIIVAASIYHEQGASRLRILKLIGNTEEEIRSTENAYHYGCAADIGVLEIIDPRFQDKKRIMSSRFPKAQWITDRMNALFPFGDGKKVCALYNGEHIHLEVPIGGFKKENVPLAYWSQFGNTGIIKPIPSSRKME